MILKGIPLLQTRCNYLSNTFNIYDKAIGQANKVFVVCMEEENINNIDLIIHFVKPLY